MAAWSAAMPATTSTAPAASRLASACLCVPPRRQWPCHHRVLPGDAQRVVASDQRPVMCTGVRAIPASLVRRKPWQTQATSSLASYPLLPGDDQGPLIHTILETDSEDIEVGTAITAHSHQRTR